ncbi:MAG TPA: prolyl oligopeptidase family serine peptidase [Gemmatimonadaceae bacterium]|nr:prolyl oligopeptidase family serine peptidase [Gemmatimonadaceae bacterium]
MSLRTRWSAVGLAAALLAAPVPVVAQAIAPASAATPATRRAAFTFAQVRSYPFPNELTAAAGAPRIAWAFNEQGRRNVWVAEGPDWRARQLTRYTADDGQEITSLAVSRDGRWVVYVRGGEHGGNWEDTRPVNAMASPTMPTMAIWSVPFGGGEPKLLAEGGDAPVLSPKGDVVAFERGGQIWTVPVDGSAEAKRLLQENGRNGDVQWAPDGSRLAFVSSRGDHAFIGIYTNDSTPIRWIAPSTSRDASPRWSPDGTRLAFVRRPGSGGAPDSILVQRHNPWAVWTADARTGEARALWTAPTTLRGSAPTTQGGTNLHWAAGDRVVFLSTQDGWPHLYSIPAAGGEALLLTPGDYMLEYITLSPDGRFLVAAANTGPREDDIDRRHVLRVPVDRAAPEVLTPGTGLEWTPVVAGDGTIAYLSATAQRPPLPAVMAAGGEPKLLAEERIPADFPTAQLVTPRQVVFEAPDGVRVHAQLFEKAGGAARKPAIIFVHGGPPRQMLLGWHYSDYYANTYANNQYLAAKGYLVLSVNYRLGIGYGDDFHRPPNAGARGAAEYQDVKAAAEWLARQPNVDPERIGIWGGSYGGFLTAMALAHDSDLFAAGVDLHGVHDWTTERARGLMERDRYEQAPDMERALEVAWQSSPVSAMATWRSPVLLIHGDDDRNVRFSQTVDLVQRLRERGIPYEELVIPDDTHHWMLHRSALLAGEATADFFDRTIGAAGGTPASRRR